MLKYKRWSRVLVVTLLVVCGSIAPAAAATDTKADSGSLQTVAQSYTTTKPLQQGLIVQLDDKDKNKVTTVTYKNAKKTYGVVVAASAAAVTLSSDAAQQAYVVTSGRYNVLVSNQNGEVDVGDFVSVSAIDGIGMKADSDVDTVLGRAVTAFNGKSNVISTTTLKDSSGKQLKVTMGMVAVDVAIVPSPLHTGADGGVPQFVQKLAVSLLGQPINPVQLYISVALFLLGAGTVVSLLYSGIQTSMTAIGRNPLARQSIMRNMIQVIIASVLIFIGCLVAVYLILKI